MTPSNSPAPLPSDHLEPLLRVARRALRFWRLAGLVFVAVGGLALGAMSLLPKTYVSEAVLFYREGLQWSHTDAVNPRRLGQKLKDMLLARTQVAKVVEELGLFPELVNSGRVADAVEEARQAIGFKFGDGDVYVLSYRGRSAAEAQRVVVKLTELLVSRNTELRTHQAELAKEFLETEAARRADDLAEKQAAVVRFLAKHPEFAQEQAIGIGATFRARARRASEVPATPRDEAAVAALRREEERLRRQLSAGSAEEQGPTPSQDALAAALRDAEVKLAAAQRELADRRSRFTEQHPDVRLARIAVAEAEAARRRAQQAYDGTDRPVPPRDAAERLRRVQRQIAELEREPAPRRVGPVDEGNATKAVAVETEWARLSRAVEEARERLEHVQTQQFSASMTASVLTSGQSGQLTVVDPANLPARPVGMPRGKQALVALALALALSLAAAVAAAILDDLIYEPPDVERLGRGRVLAELVGHARRALLAGPRDVGGDAPARPAPTAAATAAATPGAAVTSGPAPAPRPAPMQPRLITATSVVEDVPAAARAAPDPAVSGGIVLRAAGVQIVQSGPAGLPVATPFGRDLSDVVRIHRPPPPDRINDGLVVLAEPEGVAAATFRVLRHRVSDRAGVKTIMVTSPLAGEGKTYVAANLALALGDAGMGRVLLLEANFKRPSLARIFQFEPDVCFAQQLETRRAAVLQPWVVAEVVSPWLHVAAVGKPTTQPLDRRALVSCIADLQEAYDYIVIDCPAVLEGAEANLVEESADGILMALSARSSRGRAYRTAVDQLGSGRLLGVALVRG